MASPAPINCFQCSVSLKNNTPTNKHNTITPAYTTGTAIDNCPSLAKAFINVMVAMPKEAPATRRKKVVADHKGAPRLIFPALVCVSR